MIGFTFRGRHSSEFNIGFRSVDRTVLPKRRISEITIPGRSGTYEMGIDEFEKREIVGIIGIMNESNFEELRKKVREIAYWLSGSGKLIFDDERDKYYQARIAGQVDIAQLTMQPKATAKIVFSCQPFAMSAEKKRKPLNIGHNRDIGYQGTAETPTRIIIRNTGNQTITNIKIKQITKGD